MRRAPLNKMARTAELSKILWRCRALKQKDTCSYHCIDALASLPFMLDTPKCEHHSFNLAVSGAAYGVKSEPMQPLALHSVVCTSYCA